LASPISIHLRPSRTARRIAVEVALALLDEAVLCLLDRLDFKISTSRLSYP